MLKHRFQAQAGSGDSRSDAGVDFGQFFIDRCDGVVILAQAAVFFRDFQAAEAHVNGFLKDVQQFLARFLGLIQFMNKGSHFLFSKILCQIDQVLLIFLQNITHDENLL